MRTELILPARRGAVVAAILAATLLVGALLWWALDRFMPLPPTHIVMTTGPEGSAYDELGKEYEALLLEDGVTVERRPSEGDVENLHRLRDPSSGVDVGFLQGGLTSAKESPGLSSLGTVLYQPLWLFYRGKGRTPTGFLQDFHNLKVSVGPPLSGTRVLATMLLARAGIDTDSALLLGLPPEEAASALIGERIDAAAILSGWEAPAVQQLLTAPGISILPLKRVDAYVALYPYIDKVVLPEGAGDLETDNPPSSVALLAVKSSLVVRRSMHPALQHLLLDAAERIHARPGVFNSAGQFPAAEAVDLALSAEARHYYKSGRPFLQRHLPFWLAALTERMLIVLVPLIGIMLPLARAIPAALDWGIRRRILGLYSELRLLELELGTQGSGATPADLAERIDRLDRRAHQLTLPASYQPMLYTLRDHIALMRSRFQTAERGAPRFTPGTGSS
jgi:TRAP-type uncharacterized transport system substrate-binding protein